MGDADQAQWSSNESRNRYGATLTIVPTPELRGFSERQRAGWSIMRMRSSVPVPDCTGTPDSCLAHLQAGYWMATLFGQLPRLVDVVVDSVDQQINRSDDHMAASVLHLDGPMVCRCPLG